MKPFLPPLVSKKYGISDKKRPKMGLFFSYMPKRDLKLLVSPLSIRGMSL